MGLHLAVLGLLLLLLLLKIPQEREALIQMIARFAGVSSPIQLTLEVIFPEVFSVALDSLSQLLQTNKPMGFLKDTLETPRKGCSAPLFGFYFQTCLFSAIKLFCLLPKS